MTEQLALKNALKNRLDSIRIRHPSYSIRAFAKKAGISPATLSLVLMGKRKISRKLALSLSERLNFDPQERAHISQDLDAKNPLGMIEQVGKTYIQMNLDQFQLISDWRAFAVLNLIQTADFKNSTSWIAERLGITIKEVNDTLDRLKRLEMIEEKNNRVARVVPKYKTSDDIASAALRQSHSQTLDLAQVALENETVDRRDFTWLTFPMDLTKMGETKKLIRKFQDELIALNENNARPTEVYRLAMQLFPLTKHKKNKNGRII